MPSHQGSVKRVGLGCLQVPSKGVQAQADASRTEDSARTAYEKLMEEEDQAAAKAAAKKAKKLKQKAKKQQAALHETDEPAVHPESENDQEYDQFSLPHSANDGAQETSANSEAASLATGDMPTALSAFGAVHIGTDAQSSTSARAVCSTDGAKGVEAYHLPLLNSRGFGQSEAAVVTEQVASVQGGDSSSGSGSRQGGVSAGALHADRDAQFLQALFCCPITKVIKISRRRHAAFTKAAKAARGCEDTMTLQVCLTLLFWLCGAAMLIHRFTQCCHMYGCNVSDASYLPLAVDTSCHCCRP